MPGKDSSRAPSTSPMGRVLLMMEEIRAQNAATIDAVHASARQIREDMRRLEARVATLESAVQYLGGEVMALMGEVAVLKSEMAALKMAMERVENKVDSKPDLARLETLEGRVAALESANSSIAPTP